MFRLTRYEKTGQLLLEIDGPLDSLIERDSITLFVKVNIKDLKELEAVSWPYIMDAEMRRTQ